MTNLTDALHIPDTQAERDQRHLPIQRVGVKDVRYPLQLRVAGALQSSAALWDLDVALSADQKGTHMSRFVAWLDALDVPLDADALRERHAQMLDKLGADEGRIEARFSFFLRKRAPVSGLASLLDYQGRWIAETRAGVTTLMAEVGEPETSRCPCSTEISAYGAHNPRSLVRIRVELQQPVEWHELVRFAEDQASSELWPMLKRVD
jgi:GTP cyclohydrolase I